MKHLARLIAALLLTLAASPALAEDATGDWLGTLQVSPTVSLRLAVHVATEPDGSLTGTLDSLDQGAMGMKLTEIEAAPDRLAFKVPIIGGAYSAIWDKKAAAWAGTWTQGGADLPLILTRGTAAPAPAPPPLPANWEIPGNAEIERLIARRIAGRPGAGIVVGVIDPSGHRIVAGGPAGADGFDRDTLFEIGSISKIFTSLLLADMVQRGEVSLDDPARTYLPQGATMPTRDGREITLLDLATHRSGLPRLPGNLSITDAANPYVDYTEADMLEFLAGYALPRGAGAEYEYSNLGTGLLGYLLARRAGTDYETLVQQRILGPLGMDDTTIALDVDERARFATGHDHYMRPTSPWDLPALAGAGALRSTMDDMLRLLAFALGEPNAILSSAVEMTMERRAGGPSPAIAMGLGWHIVNGSGGKVLFHNGGTGGFRSMMALDPQKDRGVVVLTNSAVEPAVDDLAMHLLIGAPVAPETPVPPAPAPAPDRTEVNLSPAELDRVAGRYAFANQMVLEVSREANGRLIARMAGGPALPIFAEAPLRFFWKAVNATATFIADASGKVTGVTFWQDGQELTGKRIAE